MKSFPYRNTLLGLAATSVLSKLLPSKSQEMARVMPKKSFVRRARRSYRKVPRTITSSTEFPLPLKRTSGVTTLTLVGGGLNGFLDITLNQVLTSDLTSTFQVYKIKKVQFDLIPNLDPATGIAAGATSYHIYTANDTQGGVTAPLPLGVSAYQNYRYSSVVGGEKYRYTFYPKVLNDVNNAGTASATGSYGTNPWLTLTPNGILVPHCRLLYSIVSTTAATPLLQYTCTLWFDVKRLK